MKKLILIFLIAGFCFSASAKEINWQVIDWPPYMILKGFDNGTGQFNKLLNMLRYNMPKHQHNEIEMNWGRYWKGIAEGKPVCNIMALKNEERLKVGYFSQPASIIIPNHIIMTKKLYKELNSPTVYSIEKLIKAKFIEGYIETKRSYTPEIDAIFNNDKSFSNITRSPIPPESIFNMLHKNRIDYIIEYPVVAKYYQMKLKQEKQNFQVVQINEIKPYSYSYVVCPKNKWGKDTIGEINHVLTKLKPTEKYRKMVEIIAGSGRQEIDFIRNIYSDFLIAK